MRTLTLAFAFGLLVAVASPAMAGDNCGWGHTKTADTNSSSIAEGEAPQTPKPDQGS